MFWYLVVIVVIFLIYYLSIRPFTYWSKQGIPQQTIWKIWINNVIETFTQPPFTDTMQRLYNDFPDNRYVGTYQFLLPRLCVKDPELIKTIFVKDFDHFVDHSRFIPDDGDPILSKSLFVLSDDKWRQMRTVATPSFTSSKIKFMFGLMHECAEQFMRYFEKQDGEILEFEMKDTFARITNDVFASTHFGVDCDSLKHRNNEMYLIGEKAFEYGTLLFKLKFVIIFMIPRITRLFGVRIMNQEVIAYFKKLVQNNIRYREENKIVRPDLMHLLMENNKINHLKCDSDVDAGFAVAKETFTVQQARNRNSPLTDEDRTALVATFFGGGFDSISTLLCFAAYELALQPDIQQKLQEEVDYTMEECKGHVTYEALLRMKYLDMVISETLRKWPGGFFLDRCCTKPYTIEPTKAGEIPLHLKKGDSIWIPLFAIQRDPKFYEDPDRFNPDRFNENNRANLNPYAFLPFGVGPRQCVGSRFALLEAKLVIFHILSKYNFTVVKKTAIPLVLERRYFQLISKNGFWLGLKRRPNCTG